MYATPVIYPITFIPGRWRWILLLNPLGGIIQAYRAAIFHTQFHWDELMLSAVLVAALLIYSLFSFQKMEKQFADII